MTFRTVYEQEKYQIEQWLASAERSNETAPQFATPIDLSLMRERLNWVNIELEKLS